MRMRYGKNSTLPLDYLTPSTLKPDVLLFELFKIVQITPSSGFRRWVRYSNHGFATTTVILSFLFFIYFSGTFGKHGKL